MLTNISTHVRRGLLGITHLQQREGIPFLSVVDLPGLNKLPSQVDCRGKGFRYTKMSFQIKEKLESKVVSKENMQDFPISSAYEMAMEALSSLITRKRRGDRSPVRSKYDKLERMSMYIKSLGLEEHIDRLKIIHVAGTKGKGSTCAFCEAILRECGFKTGLFISPHLIDVRERFRLNGLDISEDKFLLYFWDCWNQLEEHVTEDLPMPPLFQFLTILAFKIFVYEKVDVAIIEVGLGGMLDSTNVIKEPVVCGITTLGMDHTETLGDTLAMIALHKAGIFKPKVPAFTVCQLPEAMDVIQERAHDSMIPLKVVAPLDHEKMNGLKLSLSGDHQFINAGLAVALCESWLRSTGNWEKTFQNDGQEDSLPAAFLRGLSTAQLSGRAQIVYDSLLKSKSISEMRESSSGELVFYLDGAHSPESMEVCAKWFSNAVKVNNYQSISTSALKVQNTKELQENGCTQFVKGKESDKILKQILLFNCMEVRDPQILIPRLVRTCASTGIHFSKAIFVPTMSTYNKVTSGASVVAPDISVRDLSWQFNLQRVWEKIIHGKDVFDKSSKMDSVQNLPPDEFLYEDISHCNPGDKYFTCSAVIPSLPLTINWLRDCARENPSLRIQVLVTGSIHLVGDVLKLLRR